MASGDLRIQAGQYWLDDRTWFDLRLTDSGWVISLCDIEQDIRYTAMVDQGKVVFSEISSLIKEHAIEHLRAIGELPPRSPPLPPTTDGGCADPDSFSS